MDYLVDQIVNDDNRYPDVFMSKKSLNILKSFEQAESDGTISWEISYRCVCCRGSPDCKISEKLKA